MKGKLVITIEVSDDGKSLFARTDFEGDIYPHNLGRAVAAAKVAADMAAVEMFDGLIEKGNPVGADHLAAGILLGMIERHAIKESTVVFGTPPAEVESKVTP